MSGRLRLMMLGTKGFALPTFEHLIDQGHQVVALVTQPDRPQGRKLELIPSPIKLSALARAIPVEQPEDVNSTEGLEMVRSYQPDLLVTAAYGQILSAELLGIARLGGINLHGSILPKYRGAAPVARAIQNGETETGVTVIRMTPRIDAGGMLSIARTPIEPDETAGQVEARLSIIGAPLIADAIEMIMAGTATFLPQVKAKVSKAPKLSKDDGVIGWAQHAQTIHNLIRAMQPWPAASTMAHGSERWIIHKSSVVEGHGVPGRIIEAKGDRLIVAAGSGAIQILFVQIVGKKVLAAKDFLLGHRVEGLRLGGPWDEAH